MLEKILVVNPRHVTSNRSGVYVHKPYKVEPG